ncbi:MAG: hypothetical protein JSS82_09240 [Bacteroidetes bacterium]|nr:hypothetical protein [Bacteroidota bacterium]
MKKLLSALLILSALKASAQDDEAPILKICPLDTTAAGGKVINSQIVQQIGGFALAFTDTTVSRTVLSVYKGNANEGLRIEMKYRYSEEDGAKKQVVNYEKISATEGAMARLYSYLFNTNIEARQLRALASNGTVIKYKDQSFMYMLDEAEFRPGYWELTLVK